MATGGAPDDSPAVSPEARQLAAAVRRASQQAHMAMGELDAAMVQALTALYERAAADVRYQIEQAVGAGDTVPLQLLRPMLQRIQAVLDTLAQHQADEMAQGLPQAADLGARPFTEAGLAATGRQVPASLVPLTGGQARAAVDEAVLWVQGWRDANGLALSDRLWRVAQGAREAVQGTLERAVVQGWGADKAAQDLLMRGQPVPAATAMAQQAGQRANLLRGAELLRDGNSGALANALRVMRTEINRAHGHAYMSSAERARADGVGIVGFRFLLSPRHPRPDICDLYATQNKHGLGPGVYPSREACPWPAHPNTLSFVTAVFSNEVTAADRAGQETTLQALQRMAPELREGVLGPTKAAYFGQGRLTTGMVRSTVGSVLARLRRTGRA